MNGPKVSHITFSSKGGAGKVAQLLYEGQKMEHGYAKLYTMTDGGVESLAFSNPILFVTALFDFFLVRKFRRNPLFSLFRRCKPKLVKRTRFGESEIIHLHWVAGMFHSKWLSNILANHSVVLTLHDMWAFTGGCHHAIDCDGYQQGCGDCPQVRKAFKESVAKSLSIKISQNTHFKSLVVVAPSKWIADKARQSLVFKDQRIEVVPNSAIIEFAQLVDKKQAREKLGISSKSFVVGCVAADLLDPQKNIESIVKEVEAFKDNHADVDLVILAVGGGMLRSDTVTIFQTGLLHDLNEIALAYVAMDAFASLSLTENFPLTVVEAAFAGVPTIALDTGGISEIVNNAETGLVISKPSEFQNALEIVVFNGKLRDYMSTNSRAFAAREFTLMSVLNRYRAIYESF